MKNKLSAILLCCILLTGCASEKQSTALLIEETPIHTEVTVSTNTTVTEPNLPIADEPETETISETQAVEETTVPKETTTDAPTVPQAAKAKPKEKTSDNSTKPKSTEPAKSEKEKPTTEATEPKHKETEPPTTVPETEPKVTAPTQPETKPSKPESIEPTTQPTVPETKPTEPIGCSHDWKTIHHDEVGHWKAGIVCDCGWTVYGKASELVSKWNVHSASFPPEESMFNHGGYGSADEWIVDEPAYDEWVCRHCGEKKK